MKARRMQSSHVLYVQTQTRKGEEGHSNAESPRAGKRVCLIEVGVGNELQRKLSKGGELFVVNCVSSFRWSSLPLDGMEECRS